MNAKGNAGIIAIAAIVVILIVLVLGYVALYNGLIANEQNVNSKWASVETQYQRRIDLLPNLVNTVKGVSGFEQSTLTKITELRSQWQSAPTQEQKVATANELESTISKLLVISENYPTLTATQAYTDLMAELAGTENRVAFARGEYNDAVQQYNTSIKTIPGVWVAGMAGLTQKTFFQAKTGADVVPDVNLS